MILALRYARALLRQFRGTLIGLSTLVLSGALTIAATPLAQLGGARPTLDSALYAAWMALFAEQVFNSTEHWHLEALSAIFPLAGAIVVGEGVVRLGLLLMSRRQGDKEWQRVVASTYRDHVVLCGLGHMGFRMLEYLLERGVPVVAIEKDPQARFLSRARARKVPVILADMKDDDALAEAQVAHARVVIAATNDDLANIEVALDARRMNPRVKIAMRQFDPEIAKKLQAGFAVDVAFSSSAVAAPIVAAQALGVNTPLPQLSRDELRLESSELLLAAGSPLVGLAVSDAERRHGIKIVLVRKPAAAFIVAPGDLTLAAGDALVCVGDAHALARAGRS